MNQVGVNQSLPKFSATQRAFNNDYSNAMAAGDPRFNVKQYDRAGFSRGGAQMNQAGIDSANKMSQGIADAYGNQLQNNAYSAGIDLQGQQAQGQFAQALGGLNTQNAYQQQMANLQRQQTAIGLLGGLLK